MSETLTRRILTKRGGAIEPLIPNPPLLTSGGAWRGIILEKHLAGADYVRRNFESYSNLIHCFNGRVRHKWQIDGRTFETQNTPGSVAIEPRGLYTSAVHVARPRPEVQWILEIAQDAAEQSLEGKPFQPKFQMSLQDRQVGRLIEILQAEVESACPTGPLFEEAVGYSLIRYLAQRHSSNSPSIDQPNGGLPRSRLNRALEFIEANLDRDLHLDELAKACGFSSFHFAKLFKQSTGASPHQYVLQRRLERAKVLLRTPGLSLSQISLEAGFADQSHLTNIFRRFLGVSPAKFRASL
jgi:AraC family transcriptional regulator